ncbi:MAG: recombination regulator RecX [Candidatus Omnitrophica bacterium]|nr:recombination regulator RecX [Candidatus Omnitrophota bacterium]MCM8800076.1 recombination regulator RecX [Candidatus Omnitrophota bacterium]
MNLKKKEFSLKKAKEYTLRLLKFRMRSESELKHRLRLKGFDEEVIDKTIEFFKNNLLIDDLKFCRLWMEERLKKPYGFYRVKDELRQKGIEEATIEKVFSEIKNNYNEEKVILNILKKKITTLKDLPAERKKQRLYNFFLRRGFSPEVVSDLINRL